MNKISTIQYKIHFLSFIVIVIGLLFSKALMSIGTMLLVINLLFRADFKNYFIEIKKNKSLLYLLLFYLIYIVSFIWSEDIEYALHDLKIKLPFLGIILVAVIYPVQKKDINYIFLLLIIELFISSFINFGSFNHFWGTKTYEDIREMSLFGSHIRYGVLISLGVAICFALAKELNRFKVIFFLLIIWFSFYTYYSQVLSGSIALIIVFALQILFFLKQKNKILFYVFIVFLSSIILLIVLNFIPDKSHKSNGKQLPKYTKEGNLYINDPMLKYDKSSFYYSICDLELKREWTKKSKISYNGLDRKNQEIRYTLIRYLDSKNLTKDAAGINKLTNSDIKNIENGIASILELQTGLIARIYSLKYQLENNKNPNGHSLLQRINYWKNGIEIAKSNWIIGVGAGDNQIEFDKQYEKVNSILYPENRLRAHNQFLTILISLGIIGLIPFVLFLASLSKRCISKNYLLGLTIITVIITTSLFEDTLETQLGIMSSSILIALIISKTNAKLNL